MTEAERMNWRMPPLALLKPVEWSPGTKLGMLMLRGYLVISVLLLIVKASADRPGMTTAAVRPPSGPAFPPPTASRSFDLASPTKLIPSR